LPAIPSRPEPRRSSPASSHPTWGEALSLLWRWDRYCEPAAGENWAETVTDEAITFLGWTATITIIVCVTLYTRLQ
jgi:hypothetical protein